MKHKPIIRKLFYHSSFARHCISFVSNFIGRTQSLDISHINTYVDQKSIGPLQQPEALLLYSIVKTTLPQTIVEFGFFHGHSALNLYISPKQIFVRLISIQGKLISCFLMPRMT
jgi:hypothetical protein